MTRYYRYSGSSSFPYAQGSMPPILPARVARTLTAAARHRLISEAAYSIAERRGFAPGHELSDWLEAEREVDRVCGLIEPSPRWNH